MKFKIYRSYPLLLSCLYPCMLFAQPDCIEPSEKQKKQETMINILQYYEEQLKRRPNDTALLQALGDAYYSLRLYPQAISAYTKLLDLEPDKDSVKIDLANSYLSNANEIDSRRLFFEVLNKDHKNAEALAGLGRLEALLGHFQDAEQLYKHSLHINPENETTLFYEAELMIDLKQYSQAQSILNNLLQKKPNAEWIKDALTRARLGPTIDNIKGIEASGNLESALKQYNELMNKYPDDVEVYILLSQVYDKLGQDIKAKEILERGLTLFPASDRLKLAQGYSLIQSHEYQKAEKVFNEVAAKTFLAPEAYAALGRIYTLKGNFSQANFYFQKALQIKPDYILALSYLAQMDLTQEKYESAEKIYQQILSIQPDLKFAQEAIFNIRMMPYEKEIRQKIKERDFEGAEIAYKKLMAEQSNNPQTYLNIGLFYQQINQPAKAIEIYELGLSHFKNDLSLMVGLANAYYKNGDYQKSKTLFEKISNKYPTNIDALLGLGLNEAAEEHYENAKAYYQSVLEMNPANQEALGNLGDLLIKLKEYSEADKIFSRLLELNPQAEWASQALYRAQLGDRFDEVLEMEKEKKFSTAIKRTNELIRQVPQSVDLYLLLGRLYEEEKNYRKAIETYYEALTKVPNENQLRLALAFALIEEKETDNAKRLLDYILREDPFKAEALLGLGRIALMKHQTAKAQEYFQQAYALDPKNLTILSYLADFYLKNQNFDLAQDYFELILKNYPAATWAEDLLERAKLGPQLVEIQDKKDSFDYDAASQLYEELIQETHEKLEYILQYGQFLVTIREYEKAISLYKDAMHLYPKSILLNNALGFAYLGKEDLKTARQLFEKSLKADPEDSEAYAGLGRAAEIQNNPEEAVEYYLKALEISPENLTALSFLAPLEDHEGNYEGAAVYYRKILEIDPKAEWAKRALKETKFGPLLEEIKEKQLANDEKGLKELFLRLIIESCGDPEYFYQLGNYYQRAKKYEVAIDTYNQGLAIDPNSYVLYTAVGLSYISEKKWPEATKVFQKALSLNPQYADALAGLGNVKTEIGQLPEANLLIEKSLKIDARNPVVLSSLGILRMKEKKYPEAAAAFKKLISLDPKAEWAKVLYENAINGKKLDELEQDVKDKNYRAAGMGYKALVSKYPDNPGYFFGEGLAYLRLKEYGKAADVFSRGYQRHPDENELLVSLGYAYLFLEEYDKAMQSLQKALRKDPKNAEAIAGVGRITAIRKNYCFAEQLFLEAIEIEPKNQSALTFYADMLMKEKRYQEAHDQYMRVQMLLKEDAPWLEEALQDAVDGPLTDAAQMLSNQEQFELAICLYKQLLDNYPYTPTRYYPLGQAYLDLFKPCQAICVFKWGLEIDPENAPLWRGIAAAYIDLEFYCCALEILSTLLEIDPKDANSWALVGRIEALTCSYEKAECYLCHALSLSPENTKALSYMADLFAEEQYFFSALELYKILRADNCCTKWIKNGYLNLLAETRPTIHYRFYDHEEYEWATNLGIWAANYEVLGGEIKIRYPICDTLYSELLLGNDYYTLRDLEFGTLLYSLDVERIRVRGKWVRNPHIFFEGGIGLSLYSSFWNGLYQVKGGIYIEPEVRLTWHRPEEKFTIGISSTSDLIARNFQTRQAKLVEVYALDSTYERKVARRTWVGGEGSLALYQAFGTNGYGMGLGWVRWRTEYCPQNLSFYYKLKLGGFTNNIPDYYTYYAQIVNYFEVKYEKYWRVLWADKFFTSANIGIGEQNTYTRFTQIIVINPEPNPPLVWDNRTYGYLGGRVVMTKDCWEAGLSSDLYRDSEKYTIWNIEATLRWTF